MTIPEIRARLHELAIEKGWPELAQLAEATRRKSCKRGRRCPVERTPELYAAIRDYHRMFPQLSFTEIAIKFGVNISAVSYAINGTGPDTNH